mmetsp:Transcript_11543/g.17726  ORF Transcript_11543/g.17726 Transcript_11543/m.17726 type:complete len:151 (+) Transcript_11543:220-672(+)
MGGVSNSGGSNVGTATTQSTTSIQDLERREQVLEADNKKMKEILDGGQMEVGGIVFNAGAEVKMWMLTNAAAPGMFIHFVDLHALVTVGAAKHATNAQVMKFEADAIKAGHTGKDEALVLASFKIEILPVILGRIAKTVLVQEIVECSPE